MSKGITVERRFHVRGGRNNRRQLREGNLNATESKRVPRVSRLMALAIRFDQLICDGVVADQAELASLGRVSRARLTQIMNLLSLAPDIQEQILNLTPVKLGRDSLSERHLRRIAAELSWQNQRRMHNKLVAND